MQVDFWQYSQGPIGRIVAQIAERVRAAGNRLLIVDGDADRRGTISAALWESLPEAFLANGEAAAPHAERQPIVLSDSCDAPNRATVAVLADGEWRDGADAFERTILLFGAAQVEAARTIWRRFDGREDVTRGYFAQESGKWVKKA